MTAPTMTKKAQAAADRADAIARLRELCPPGSTVYTVLRRVSRSGMMRHISLHVIHDGQPFDITGLAARAIGTLWDRDTGGLKMGGCGMDMGFEAVYVLAATLYRDGFGCTGEGCPSNDHSNGDRDYTPHPHRDGGYALRHRWL